MSLQNASRVKFSPRLTWSLKENEHVKIIKGVVGKGEGALGVEVRRWDEDNTSSLGNEPRDVPVPWTILDLSPHLVSHLLYAKKSLHPLCQEGRRNQAT